MAHTATAVDEHGVTFVLGDRYRGLGAVRLVQDLGLSDLVFKRERTEWRLRLPRPPVDRMEYLFDIEDANARRHTILDPANPRRAPGAFGDKSELTFPGYAPPAWLDAAGIEGTEESIEIAAPLLDATVTGSVWSPAALAGPAPLVVVHDGPEFAQLGGFTRYLAVAIAERMLPPLRAAMLAPGERNDWYSANDDYAATLIDAVLPALPAATARIGVGVSLGAVAMLHAHRSHNGAFDGLLLQSGSFFTADLDQQEAQFSGWDAVTEFVTSVHEASDDSAPVPTVMTCGVPEENLANNQRMAETLARLGYSVQITAMRDTHNYTAWRDALHPHLTGLISSVATANAA